MNNKNDVVPDNEPQCMLCGSSDVHTVDVSEDVQVESIYGIVAVKVTLPAQRCEECGSVIFAGESEEPRELAASAARRGAIAEDILQIRGATNMTRDEWLSLTRVGDASLSRWENKQNEPNAALINYLYLLGFGDNVERLRHRRLKLTAATVSHAGTEFPDCVKDRLSAIFPGSSFTQEKLDESRNFDPSARQLLELACTP